MPQCHSKRTLEDTLVSLYIKLSKMAVVPHRFSDFLIPKEDLNILDMVNYALPQIDCTLDILSHPDIFSKLPSSITTTDG